MVRRCPVCGNESLNDIGENQYMCSSTSCPIRNKILTKRDIGDIERDSTKFGRYFAGKSAGLGKEIEEGRKKTFGFRTFSGELTLILLLVLTYIFSQYGGGDVFGSLFRFVMVFGFVLVSIGLINYFVPGLRFPQVDKYLPSLFLIGMIVIFFITGLFSFQNSLSILVVIIIVLISLFVTHKYNSATASLLIIPIFIIFLFLASGWGGIFSDALGLEKAGAQTGGVDVGTGTWFQIKQAGSNIWILLSDPNRWYEQQFVSKGKRDVDASALALELTKVYPTPWKIPPGDEVTLFVEAKHLGKQIARDVKIGAFSYDGEVKESPKDKGDMFTGETRIETFSLPSPDNCYGKIEAVGYVKYDYTVSSTSNLGLINREYYEELVKQGKQPFFDVISTSSEGPLKATIRTSRQQPIPYNKSDGTAQNFTIFFSLNNERDGIATYEPSNIKIYVPEELEPVECTDLENKEEYYIPKDDKQRRYVGEGITSFVDFLIGDKKYFIDKTEIKYFSCKFKYEGNDFEQEKTLFLKMSADYSFINLKDTDYEIIKIIDGPEDSCKEVL